MDARSLKGIERDMKLKPLTKAARNHMKRVEKIKGKPYNAGGGSLDKSRAGADTKI